MSEIQVGQINSTDGSTAITTGADGYVSFAKTQIGGRRNLIINGGFDVWQRGTSFTVSNGIFTADRWVLSNIGSGGAGNVSQQSFTVGQTEVPGEPQYFFRYSQTTAGGETRDKVYHKVEDVRTGAGQTVTLSFWAKANATKTLAIRFAQSFGSGGSATVSTDAVTYTATTSWQKFTFTETLPSISGKTIGAGSYLGVSLTRELNNFSTFDIDISQVQLEVGTVATPFEHRSFHDELIACKRYFQTNAAYGIFEAGADTFSRDNVASYSANNLARTYRYAVEMRGSPTVTFSGTAITSGSPPLSWYNGSWQSATNVAASQTVTNGFIMEAQTLSSSPSFGQSFISQVNWSADAEL